MRIAKVTGSFLPIVGGMEWKVHYLGEEYQKRGHDVTVFATRPPGAYRHAPLGVSPGYRLVRCGYHLPAMGRLGINGWLMRQAVLAEHRRRPFDVLHGHHLGLPAYWCVQIARRTGLPVVVTTCGDDIYTDARLQYGVRLSPRLDRIVRFNVKHVNVIGSISRAVRAELESIGATARLVDIPNGVPWDQFQTGPSTMLRDRLKLSPEAVIVLSVGRNINFKRYDLGIAAFARAAAGVPAAYYVLIGRDMEPLRPLVEEVGMRDRILFVEQMPLAELPQAFHSADIFFNPSEREGFAQVNAQALASGLPCVLTDAPGNVDAADHGGALVARCYDVDSMAARLGELMVDRQKRLTLGSEAYQAGQHYAWSRIAEQYLEVLSSLKGKEVA